MTAKLVYLIKPHRLIKTAHELQIEYEDGKTKTFIGTQLKKSLHEVDQLLEQKENEK